MSASDLQLLSMLMIVLKCLPYGDKFINEACKITYIIALLNGHCLMSNPYCSQLAE